MVLYPKRNFVMGKLELLKYSENVRETLKVNVIVRANS